MRRWRAGARMSAWAIAAAVLCACAPAAMAQQASSPNYQVNEVFFGSGGDLNDCSASYCAKESVGELGVGNTASPNYQAQGGFNTDRSPSLTFIVNGGTTDLGVLSASSTATATATFSVKTYLAGSGYVVQTVGNPPTSNGSSPHQLTALSSPASPATGTEQFGMNLVANTIPRTFGADPVQVPDSTFSFGAAASGYNTPNKFKYANGDIVAQSTVSSGETDYTVSYIYNISNATPDGTYTFNDILVATSTF